MPVPVASILLVINSLVLICIDGELGNDSDTSNWNSRVRLKVKARTKGGAYAIARVRMADATWDGAQDQSKGTAQGSNIYTDYAYIGTPMGPVPYLIEAGLMPFNVTKFSVYDDTCSGRTCEIRQ